MKVFDARSGIEMIEHEECLRLLATGAVGRLGVVLNGHPEIFPVNYVLDGEHVVFRTAVGPKLTGALRAGVVFEVDNFDPRTRSGWSVVVHGTGHDITPFDAPQLVARAAELPVHPWASGEKPHVVRITPTRISGRRVSGSAQA